MYAHSLYKAELYLNLGSRMTPTKPSLTKFIDELVCFALILRGGSISEPGMHISSAEKISLLYEIF